MLYRKCCEASLRLCVKIFILWKILDWYLLLVESKNHGFFPMVFSPFLRHVPGEMFEIMSFLSNCTVILSFSSNYDFVPAVIYPNSISSSYYLEKNSIFISEKKWSNFWEKKILCLKFMWLFIFAISKSSVIGYLVMFL